MIFHSDMNKVIVVGTNSLAEIATVYFGRDHLTVDGYCEEEPSKRVFQLMPVIPLDHIHNVEEYDFFSSIGYDNKCEDRKRVFQKLELMQEKFNINVLSYIHPEAFVDPLVRIKRNVFIMEKNVIQLGVIMGDNITLWSGNHIGHHTVIGDHTFISSHVVIAGNCLIGERCFFGVNSTVLDGIKIGDGTIIGAGSVVNRDIPHGTWVGNPVRRIH